MHKVYLAAMLGAPLICSVAQFLLAFGRDKERETVASALSKFVYVFQFVVTLAALGGLDARQVSFVFVELESYAYDFMFVVNQMNLWLALAFSLLFLLTERLSQKYLHAEEEHAKFYSLKTLLNASCLGFVFSSNIDFLFFNWEIVGISSALLISYFYRRNQAVESSLYAFSIYRLCDAAFLLASLFLYYFYHTESVSAAGTGWPAFLLGVLIFVAIMGKSGIYPFSSWLPLALEGPTPSSNLYYMTLSTHLGAILLIKTWPVWSASAGAKILMALFCAATIFVSTLSARTQSNIKGALAYSALAQVSLIILEILAGWHVLAAAHLSLHIFYRLAQMAFSPSIIDQYAFYERLAPENFSRPSLPDKLFSLALLNFHSERAVELFFRLAIKPVVLATKAEAALLNLNRSKRWDAKRQNIVQGEVK